MDMKVSSTIGFERHHSPMLQIADEDEFVEKAIADLSPQPPNFEAIVARNRGPLVRQSVDIHPLTPRQVEGAQREGAVVIDVRTELQFDDAHIPGSVSITALRAGFGTKLSWVAHDAPVVLVGRDGQEARHAAELSAAVGVTNLTGFLAGGMTIWREERLPVTRTPRLTVEELYEQEIQILDVREQGEWDAGHIEGSVHKPYHDIRSVPDGLDAAEPIAAICGSGQRSAVAASLLEVYGAKHPIHVVDGGVDDYLKLSAAASSGAPGPR